MSSKPMWNARTQRVEWVADDGGGAGAWVGWLVLILGGVLALAVVLYLVLLFLPPLPTWNVRSLIPDLGGVVR